MLLLDAGVNPNQRGFNDYTALHYAVAERNIDALRMMIDAGADPRMRTRIRRLRDAARARERRWPARVCGSARRS